MLDWDRVTKNEVIQKRRFKEVEKNQVIGKLELGGEGSEGSQLHHWTEIQVSKTFWIAFWIETWSGVPTKADCWMASLGWLNTWAEMAWDHHLGSEGKPLKQLSGSPHPLPTRQLFVNIFEFLKYIWPQIMIIYDYIRRLFYKKSIFKKKPIWQISKLNFDYHCIWTLNFGQNVLAPVRIRETAKIMKRIWIWTLGTPISISDKIQRWYFEKRQRYYVIN